jgi:restriction endonuclease-like protein
VVVDLREVMGPDGVMRMADLAARTGGTSVRRWVSAGRLLRPLPHVVVLPECADGWRTRALAAVLSTDGVLSHHSALSVWRLAAEIDRVHVSIDARRRAPDRARQLTVHRVTDLSATRVDGLPVTPPARTLVDVWGQANGGRRPARFRSVARAAVISAVRSRCATPAGIRTELERRPELPGRAALVDLLVLVAGGSHSELEIWGLLHVLDVPGLPPCLRQHEVRLPHARAFLDAAWPEAMLAVELDGAAFHGSAEARERDLRRDAALAALGWLVLRFSYQRLTRDPVGCRREIQAVHRRRLGLGCVR